MWVGGNSSGDPVPSKSSRRHDGARRLLLGLIRGGLDESAVPQAAALAIALDVEREIRADRDAGRLS